jgi:V8-like Glu-specific endopeptidase
MFSRILLAAISIICLVSPALAADDTAMISSVMKIKTYDRNSIDGSYSSSQYGSAILIDSKRIITNAHVILGPDGKSPMGYYEICRSEKGKKVPTCFTTGKLISYDIIADLALLELDTPIIGAK